MTTCTKRPYDSEKQARASLRALRSKGMRRLYRCTRCNRWHLSSER